MPSTVCRLCKWECRLILEYDQSGEANSIKIDPKTSSVGCVTGKNILSIVNNPARLREPLQRCGEKGENNWRPISWEEAISLISQKFQDIIADYGKESLFTCVGYNRPFLFAILERFTNVLGLANTVTPANVCHVPRILAYKDTFGFTPRNDINEKTQNILLWGFNPASTRRKIAVTINKAVKNGSKLIVIDPLETNHARWADKWLPIRPGTDLALALGMINLIIQENWYDKDFVNQYTVGFDKLAASAKAYDLDRVAAITGLTPEEIQETARLFALKRPSVLMIGNALESNFDSYQVNRALAILTAITANVDLAGGLLPDELPSARNLPKNGKLAARQLMDPATKEKRLGKDHYRLSSFTQVGGQDIVSAILTEKPYPIKGGYILGANPVMTWADSKNTARALSKLDFLVVADFFLTPTAMLADIVLPVTSYLETESIFIDENDNVFYVPQLLAAGNLKSDIEIINALGHAMGYGKHFWPDMESFWNELLAPYGITLAELKEKGGVYNQHPLESYQVGTYRKFGFPTSDKKIQLYSQALKEQGVEPLPAYNPLSQDSGDYPYYYTNYKTPYFIHTAGRQNEPQRAKEPEALAYISVDIAAKEQIKGNDLIIIETENGRIEQRASISRKVAANTVVASHGWWYPEKEANPYDLKACVNNLTSYQKDLGQDIPAFTTRGLRCKVYKKRTG